jgi:hypothetical protein
MKFENIDKICFLTIRFAYFNVYVGYADAFCWPVLNTQESFRSKAVS